MFYSNRHVLGTCLPSLRRRSGDDGLGAEWGALKLNEEVDDWDSTMTARGPDAGEHGVGMCTFGRAIAAADLSGDDPGPDLTLGEVVGGLDPVDIQEAQQVRAMLG